MNGQDNVDRYIRHIKRLEAENGRLKRVLEARPQLNTFEQAFDEDGVLVCLGDHMACTRDGHESKPFVVDSITLGKGARISGEYVDQSDIVWGVPARWCRHCKERD